MDNQQEQFNSDLTIVGLVLILLFISYYSLVHLYKANTLDAKFSEAKQIVVDLDSELYMTKKKLKELEEERSEEALISQIIKDIATSWNSRRKD